MGLRKWIEEQGHELVTTSDKEGEDSKFEKELVDAEVIITTPYVLLHSLTKFLYTRRDDVGIYRDPTKRGRGKV